MCVLTALGLPKRCMTDILQFIFVGDVPCPNRPHLGQAHPRRVKPPPTKFDECGIQVVDVIDEMFLMNAKKRCCADGQTEMTKGLEMKTGWRWVRSVYSVL